MLKNRIKKNKNIDQTSKTKYNLSGEVISNEQAALEDRNWNNFIEKQGKYPTKYWKKIKGNTNNSIQTLKHNDQLYYSPQDKAKLFSELLEKNIFK